MWKLLVIIASLNGTVTTHTTDFDSVVACEAAAAESVHLARISSNQAGVLNPAVNWSCMNKKNGRVVAGSALRVPH